MVGFLKEVGSVIETSTNRSCPAASRTENQLSSSGLEEWQRAWSPLATIATELWLKVRGHWVAFRDNDFTTCTQSRLSVAVQKTDVRQTDANSIKQISTAVTCVTVPIVGTFVRSNSHNANDELEVDQGAAYDSNESDS